jgi:hypothetical protein
MWSSSVSESGSAAADVELIPGVLEGWSSAAGGGGGGGSPASTDCGVELIPGVLAGMDLGLALGGGGMSSSAGSERSSGGVRGRAEGPDATVE